jgi:hypothetical protein
VFYYLNWFMHPVARVSIKRRFLYLLSVLLCLLRSLIGRSHTPLASRPFIVAPLRRTAEQEYYTKRTMSMEILVKILMVRCHLEDLDVEIY